MNYKNSRKGITLIELILVLALSGIIIQLIFSMYFVGNRSFNVSKDIGFAQQELRNASLLLSKELKTVKMISDNQIGDESNNNIILVGKEDGYYLTFSNATAEFGPFENASFNLSIENQDISILLTSKDYSNVSQEVSVFLENWDEDFIEFSSNILYYTKHE